MPVRVYYEDTDAGGIVYHANYLKYAERGRTELLRAVGFDHDGLLTEHGALFAVRRCAIEFVKPARLDDALAVETEVVRLRGASLEMRQTIRRGAAVLATVEVLVALIDAAGRPTRAPRALAEALQRYEAAEA
ncbi:MAG: tol-pal system-associated acyl-CoA thioesterase [Alphaproteobacteria bacterium]|nr:tol-pal system-associated acyl-CoA thioesterase [Alphaproteobacteria bacterium]